ncbi:MULTISPECIES: DUF4253 domain-containing protein [Streptomyces]|uniref:DUF4253 domain-containing protein n=1 Tax=Streptomyces violaceoruber TaxID=1935 RepID=A0ACD4X0B0_STRVN|nr:MULTISPECIES: DUF4253 domain-containing protein [Streptomyces]WOZ03156.1 DUF4253 domain-containing protein [Streptomyces violaceoruber]WTE23447.1 DUF4253 domain-containing protein [Streptomyces anthocyanicus]
MNDTAKFSAVVRGWEHRFGARGVAVGFSTLHLGVASPPADEHEALLVAAEHFAFCPDNMWQGNRPYTLAAYAERITGVHHGTSGGTDPLSGRRSPGKWP